MTKAEIEAATLDAAIYYFEYEYPVVTPDLEVLEVIDAAMSASLTPLENAYVRWMIELGNSENAVDRLIHPAFYYDKERFGSKYFKAKPTLTTLLREIRRNCPYLRLYSSDYLAGLLHDEIQNLRSPNRKERLYGVSANPAYTVGKKSLHDQEMEEVDRLLACLKQIQELKLSAGGSSNAGTKQSDLDSGIDRVIANAKDLIHRRENGTGGGTV